jgi:NTE family protein
VNNRYPRDVGSMTLSVPQPIIPAGTQSKGRGPTQVAERQERRGVALCLSGGGFRAAIFHAGALRRLNELGVLAKVDTFSCVSGGSIIGGYLASAILNGLSIASGRYDGLDAALEEFLKFVRRDIRTLPTLARLKRWQPPGRAPRRIQAYYEKLVGKVPLAKLPEHPRFIFCATDLFFANSWVSERTRVGDYLAGYVRPPPDDWTLARAIALSSCFPPVFDPAPAAIDPNQFEQPEGPEGEPIDLSDEESAKLTAARKQIRLTDGGVYDNLGLEPVWKRHATVLVSDGGKPLQHKYVPPGLRLMRYGAVIQNQVGALRKRWLIDIYQRAKTGNDSDAFDGAYWGIMSSTSSYRRNPGYGYSKGLAATIANIRTDLNPFSPNEIAVLVKHGYELADIAINTHATPLAEFHGAGQIAWPEKVRDEEAVANTLEWSNCRFLSTFTSRSNNLLT